jgi:hypothetical protein
MQVMQRLFALLANLDTGPSHRSTDLQAKPELLVQSTHLGKVWGRFIRTCTHMHLYTCTCTR